MPLQVPDVTHGRPLRETDCGPLWVTGPSDRWTVEQLFSFCWQKSAREAKRCGQRGWLVTDCPPYAVLRTPFSVPYAVLDRLHRFRARLTCSRSRAPYSFRKDSETGMGRRPLAKAACGSVSVSCLAGIAIWSSGELDGDRVILLSCYVSAVVFVCVCCTAVSSASCVLCVVVYFSPLLCAQSSLRCCLVCRLALLPSLPSCSLVRPL